MDILEISNDIEKKNITRYILEALPDWFGIPESREEYIEDSVVFIWHCMYNYLFYWYNYFKTNQFAN